MLYIIAGIGITNQRETTVVWDKVTGEPLHNAIGELSEEKIQLPPLVFRQIHVGLIKQCRPRSDCS